MSEVVGKAGKNALLQYAGVHGWTSERLATALKEPEVMKAFVGWVNESEMNRAVFRAAIAANKESVSEEEAGQGFALLFPQE